MNTSEKTQAFAPALVAMWGELENPKVDSVNPHFGNKYAGLPALLDAVRPALQKHGFSLHQGVLTDPESHRDYVLTRLQHTSGEWGEWSVPLMPERGGPQGMGSALTYARRQCLCAALGIAGEDDDDGEVAEKESKPKKKAPPKDKPLIDSKGVNTAEDKGYTVDELREEIRHWLLTMSDGDKDGAADMLEVYSSFEGKDGDVVSTRDLGKLSIGWARTVHHKVKEAYEDYIAGQVMNGIEAGQEGDAA